MNYTIENGYRKGEEISIEEPLRFGDRIRVKKKRVPDNLEAPEGEIADYAERAPGWKRIKGELIGFDLFMRCGSGRLIQIEETPQ